jgi:LAO/AO transport system kinase
VLVPESGDAIQAMKAGLMEIADIFVVNKADREGADRAVLEIETILELKSFPEWYPPVLQAVASSNTGITDIVLTLEKHQTFLKSGSRWQQKRTERTATKVRELVRRQLETSFWNDSTTSKLNSALNRAEPLSGSPYRLARELLDRFSQQE